MFKKIQDSFKETGLINELCEHLRSIGINATVLESANPEYIGDPMWKAGPLGSGNVLGCVKVENKNIDLILVERGGGQPIRYLYEYLTRANVEALENKLEAKGEPKTKGFMSKEIVDYKWEGKDLAQLLNGDSDLRNMLLKGGLDKLEVKPDKKNQCVRIIPQVKIPTRVSVGIGGLPSIPIRGGGMTAGRKEFPTLEEFEAYDRIAQHIRSITLAKP